MRDTDKDQTEVLFNELVEFAEKMLRQYREFHPFGGYLLDDGTVTQVGANMHDDANRSGVQRASVIESSLLSVATSLRPLAVGLATNVVLPAESDEASDAVLVALEHRNGYSAEVFLRYLGGEADQRFEFTSTSAQAGRPNRFFRS